MYVCVCVTEMRWVSVSLPSAGYSLFPCVLIVRTFVSRSFSYYFVFLAVFSFLFSFLLFLYLFLFLWFFTYFCCFVFWQHHRQCNYYFAIVADFCCDRLTEWLNDLLVVFDLLSVHMFIKNYGMYKPTYTNNICEYPEMYIYISRYNTFTFICFRTKFG